MPHTDALTAFAERAADSLRADERVRALWLTGSLAAGTADAQSDVDLRAAVPAQDFAAVEAWWPRLLDRIAPTVWRRRWPGPPDEAIIGAISTDYLRFDVVIQSAADTRLRTLEAARLLFDKDNLAEHIVLTTPTRHDPLAHVSYVVEEYIRLVGMLPIVVERDDVVIGMEGHFALHSLLLSLLLMENGIDRNVTGKRHVAAFLTDEQRALLAGVPPLEPTMASVIQGRLAYARLFFPRAQRLMEANSLTYPAEFETATRRHLAETLGLSL
ncbi:MAG TPA: hypothetical protein VH599_14710 [Ktedonobacterales bacterium]|jgi:hypothetical protein